MPSPFPGMDPYLEAPDIWPDFHDALASEIRGALNQLLPPPYYARLQMRPEVGIGAGASTRRIVPDVSVQRPREPETGGVAVADQSRTEVSESLEIVVSTEQLRHAYVEVRDSQRDHELVSLIEIVSPSNKRPGVDRQTYLNKQREILDSAASLIEVDLLRTGQPVVATPEVIDTLSRQEPSPQYLVSVNRSWRRGGEVAYQMFPFTLRDPLPCVPVPLREGEEEVPLDLQYVFRLAYDRGPYARGAIEYSQPADPLLEEHDATWAAERVAEWLKARTGGNAPKHEPGP